MSNVKRETSKLSKSGSQARKLSESELAVTEDHIKFITDGSIGPSFLLLK